MKKTTIEEQKQTVKPCLAVTIIHTFSKFLHINDSQPRGGKLEKICFLTIKNEHDWEVELTSKIMGEYLIRYW